MAQETEATATTFEASTLESPSPKRRNRKKGRRGSTAGGDDDGDEHETTAAVLPCVSSMDDAATADLISLPSPVAAVTSTSADVFATLESTPMEQAMQELTLMQTTDTMAMGPQAETTVKEDGILKLSMHPSSGRLPVTPPPTPEPFLVHSPEKEQSKVVPMSSDVHQLLQTVVETPTEVEVTIDMTLTQTRVEETCAAAVQDKGETAIEGESMPVSADEVVTVETVKTVEENELVPDTVMEQEASTLSSSLADMRLGNGAGSYNESVVAITDVDSEQPIPVPDDNVALPSSPTANVDASSISATTEAPVPSRVAEIGLPTTLAEPLMMHEAAPVETPAATESAPAEIPTALEPIPAKTSKSVEQANPVLQNQESKTLSESLQSPRRNKRKGDSPEPKPHSIPVTTSRVFPKPHPSKAAAASTTSVESAVASKQVTAKDSSLESQPQARPAKRKGESEIKPPPAPTTTTAVTKEIRPKRLIARSNSRSTLNKASSDPVQKPVAAQDNRKESIMNPTASSMARATAAEARKALLTTAAAKKVAVRNPMRTKFLTKSVVSVSNPPSAQDKSLVEPPALDTIEDIDDSQRNVKRRLNATEAEAASKRLYEDAKEAKARKDARRAELQETYTFAPLVNNFKRRAIPGDTEGDPSQDHFSRLHAQAKNLLEKKRELQQQHERDGCTFTPSISARAKRLAQPSSGPRYENLYKHAQEIKQKREEKLLEKAKTTEEQCPFKPKITASKSPVKTKPLYDSERDKQKRLALEQKKIQAEMSECTFKPKVSAKRFKPKTEGPVDSIADAVTGANPYNRLYQASIERTERLQKLRQERDEEEKAQAPFQPKITARSRVLKAKGKTKEPFHKRLYNKDYLKRLDTEREQRRLEEEQQFTFKPEINEPPEEIKAKVNERASPRKTIFERLYDEKEKMKEKIEMGEELRLQKEMAECTFRPLIEVDGVQSNGEPAPPVWERLTSYDKAQVIDEREKLKEQLEMQECTFKPEVKSPDALMMKRSPSFNVFDRLSGSNSPFDPTRASFITTRPNSSPARQSPDTKNESIGRIVKLTKSPIPTERKKPSRTYSSSQPSSVNKPPMKRSTSFSAASSLTISTADVLSSLVGGSRQPEAVITPDRVATQPLSVTENYESWSTELDAKLRHL